MMPVQTRLEKLLDFHPDLAYLYHKALNSHENVEYADSNYYLAEYFKLYRKINETKINEREQNAF